MFIYEIFVSDKLRNIFEYDTLRNIFEYDTLRNIYLRNIRLYVNFPNTKIICV